MTATAVSLADDLVPSVTDYMIFIVI